MEERTVSSRQAFAGRLLKVRVDEVVMADGRPATREIIEHPGAVAILAWDGARLAMVRQWRQAAGRPARTGHPWAAVGTIRYIAPVLATDVGSPVA